MEEADIWGFAHATGAGCASIAAWESLHQVLSGVILMAVFGGATVIIMVITHKHHKRYRKVKHRKSGS